MIYDPVMVNDDNYVHLLDDTVLSEHPYKYQVLEYHLKLAKQNN
jgi:hypothetical protein